MTATLEALNDNGLVVTWPDELVEQAAQEAREREARDRAREAPDVPALPEQLPAALLQGTDEYARARRDHHAELERANRSRGGSVPVRLAVRDEILHACACLYCCGACECKACFRMQHRIRRGGR